MCLQEDTSKHVHGGMCAFGHAWDCVKVGVCT